LQLVEIGPRLADRGFRVLSIAAPGAGESPPLPTLEAYRLPRLADLVAETADALDVDRFVFMGASWGASIGVHLTTAYPDRIEALILIDAGHTDVTTDRPLEERVKAFEAEQSGFAFDSWDAFFDFVKGRRRAWRDSLEPRYRLAMEARSGKIAPRSDPRAAAWALEGVRLDPPSATHARLAELATPTLLVIASDNDTSEAVERFKATVPHATVEQLESGHDVIEDAPDALVALVVDWLARVPH
jgi:pimeloyl-ACP methyl ester carboxylesterase